MCVRRLTESQLAFFGRSEGKGIRARCTAGTALALRTDSPLLAGARAYLGLDVEVDGARAHGLRLVPHRPWCFADGIHPNDLGAVHYGVHLARSLRQARGHGLDAREARP